MLSNMRARLQKQKYDVCFLVLSFILTSSPISNTCISGFHFSIKIAYNVYHRITSPLGTEDWDAVHCAIPRATTSVI